MLLRINTKRVTDKIQSALRNLLKSDEMYVDIANFTVKRIQDKARLQKRMIQDGYDNAKTASLSPGYIRKRKSTTKGEDGTDSQFFLPNVVNSQLTYTGQLLKSLVAKVLRSGLNKGSVSIEFKGTRKDGETNSSVYKDLLNRNSEYEILALSKKAIALIQNKVLSRLRQELIKKRLK